MNKKIKYNSKMIDLINKSYHYHKRLLFEVENGVKNYDYFRVRTSKNVVSHIEAVASEFSGKLKLVIDNDVIGDKKGTKWYTEYFSAPSYYRARQIAYDMFLENIEK